MHFKYLYTCYVIGSLGCIDTSSDVVISSRHATNSLPVCSRNSNDIENIDSACALPGTTFLRANSLPTCEWGATDRSYAQFIRPGGHRPPLATAIPKEWVCIPDGGSDFDGCSYDPTGRPQHAQYFLEPLALGAAKTLVWPDSTSLYGGVGMACQHSDASVTVDQVSGDEVAGRRIAGGSCDLPNPTAQSILAEVNGDTVIHVRPASVRGQALLGKAWWSASDPMLAYTLAIQTNDAQGWTDFAISQGTIGAAGRLIEVQALVPPGLDIRLQMRAATVCSAQKSPNYFLNSLRIEAETCIPDQTNPGSCL